MDFLTSTKVPIFASRPTSVPGRTYANGPTSTPDAILTLPRMTVNGWIVTSFSISTSPSIHVDCGSTIVTPGEHVRLVDAVAQRGGGRCELGARVDSLDLARIVGDVHRNRLAVLHEEADCVGEVELALRVLRLQPLERGPELLAGEDVDRRVDLAELELVRHGVGRLDDAREPAVPVADDASVLPRVGRLEREDGRGRALAPVRVEQLAQRVRRQQRRVAGEDEHVAVRRAELRARRANGVAGAERSFLDRDLEPVEAVARLRRRDDDDRLRAGVARGGDDPVDHAPAEQRVEVLRRRGTHASAEAGGHDESCDVVGHRQGGWGARIRTWDRGTKTRCLTTWLRPRDRPEV